MDIPTNFVCVLFGPPIPSLRHPPISLFFYTCIYNLSIWDEVYSWHRSWIWKLKFLNLNCSELLHSTQRGEVYMYLINLWSQKWILISLFKLFSWVSIVHAYSIIAGNFKGFNLYIDRQSFFFDISDHSYFAAFNSRNALISYLKFVDLILTVNQNPQQSRYPCRVGLTSHLSGLHCEDHKWM